MRSAWYLPRVLDELAHVLNHDTALPLHVGPVMVEPAQQHRQDDTQGRGFDLV